ncbi:MAG: hypothetical protein IKV01_03040 [Clostridia bacterium]|nr:hypothetical protein [Clostridia bacterium]
MNAEKLHDALNYLDDSVILETDRLRHKKKKTVIFRRFVSVAACICIVATTVFGIGHMRSIKENSPLDENFETSQNNGDIPPAPENSQSTENQPPAPDNSDPSYNPAPPAEESESAEESAPSVDEEKDETSESYEASAPADESAPEDEGPPAEEAPPSEEAPEDKEHQIVLTVTEITENGFKGYITDRNDIYDPNTDVTVIYKGEKLPETGDTVYVYFFGHDKTTVYAERIFIVKE